MKALFVLLLASLTFLSNVTFAQSKLNGKYQAWFDNCDRKYNHFSMVLEIESDQTVKLTYQDDTQKKKATGKIRFVGDSIFIEPFENSINPKTIHDYFDKTSLWMKNGNIIWTHFCPGKKKNYFFKKIE